MEDLPAATFTYSAQNFDSRLPLSTFSVPSLAYTRHIIALMAPGFTFSATNFGCSAQSFG
jgi:hypothetical protein